MSATEIDPQKLEAVMGQAVLDMGAAISAPLFLIGDRLGLYKAMAGAGPLKSTEVAERAGVAERSVREWLRNQAAGGYVDYDPAADTYDAAARAGDRPRRRGQPGLPARRLRASPSARCADEPRITEAVPQRRRAWAGTSTTTGVFRGCERFFRPGYNANLVAELDPGARRRRGEAARRAQGRRRRLRPRRLDRS